MQKHYLYTVALLGDTKCNGPSTMHALNRSLPRRSDLWVLGWSMALWKILSLFKPTSTSLNMFYMM